MAERKGEKSGWTWGWIGGFAWVALLAAIFLVRGQWAPGLTGMVLFGMAAISIRVNAPWRRPTKPYWQLLLPLYALFFLTISWAIWAFGDVSNSGLNGWMLFLLLPILMPLFAHGKRTWLDGESRDRQ